VPSADRATLIGAEKVRVQYRNMPTAFMGCAAISCPMLPAASFVREDGRSPRACTRSSTSRSNYASRISGGLPILHKPLSPARLRTLMAHLLRAHTDPRLAVNAEGHRDVGLVLEAKLQI